MSTRVLTAAEFELYLHHLLELDSSARFCRFGSHLSDESIKKYAKSLTINQNIIIGHFVDSKMVGAALIAFDSAFDKKHCELAISVLPAYQKLGIGKKLLKRALTWAKGLGFKKVFSQCLRDNHWIINQLKKLGFQVSVEDGEAFASLEPYVWERPWIANLISTEILEWNHYVMESIFVNWRGIGYWPSSSTA
jgi:GNAT superfamily N-acetyltransferase